MRKLFPTLASALIGFTSLAAQGTDFRPLLSVTERSWPEKNHIGVVCDYRASQDQVRDLARNAAAGTMITVVDTHSPVHLASAQQLLKQHGVDYVVLMPQDPIFFEGSFHATTLVGRMAGMGIPSVGTRPVGLRQGAVFSIGPETNGELLVTNRLIGTVSVILPNQQARFSAPVALGATLQVVGGFE